MHVLIVYAPAKRDSTAHVSGTRGRLSLDPFGRAAYTRSMAKSAAHGRWKAEHRAARQAEQAELKAYAQLEARWAAAGKLSEDAPWSAADERRWRTQRIAELRARAAKRKAHNLVWCLICDRWVPPGRAHYPAKNDPESGAAHRAPRLP